MSSPAQEIATLSKPSMLYDENRAALMVQGIEKGASIRDAAVAVGFDPNKVHSWIQTGEKSKNGKGKYAALAYSVRRAQAKRREELRDLVLDLGKQAKQWTAPMTLLERESPEEYGKPQSGGKGVTVNVALGSFERTVHQLAEPARVLPDGNGD